MMQELNATPGFDFFDTKYSGMSLIVAADIPAITDTVMTGTVHECPTCKQSVADFKPDASVNIGGANKVYGPYRPDRVFSRGNGKIVFVGYKVGSNGKSQKPMTKGELEELARDQAVQLAAMKQQLAQLQSAPAKSK
jgi:hypothetical protein